MKNKQAFYDFSANKKTSVRVDVGEAKTKIKIKGLDLESNILPLSVDYIMDPSQDFALSPTLDQSIAAEPDGYSYIDQSGEKHYFTEKHYYLNNGERVEIPRSELENISIDQERKLSIKISDVFKEVTREFYNKDGLTFNAPLNPLYIGIENIEQRSDEEKQLEDTVWQLDKGITDCEKMLSEHVIYDTDADFLAKSSYELTTLTENEIKSYAKNTTDTRIILPFSAIYDMLTLAKTSADNPNADKMHNLQIDNLGRAKISAKDNFINSYKDFQTAKETLAQKSHELKVFKSMNPKYSVSKDNVMLHFNEDKTLCAISDNHNNIAAFEFDIKTKKILSIYDKNNVSVKLEYNQSGLIESLTDHRGRKTVFSYSNSKLDNVAHADGNNVKFEYPTNQAVIKDNLSKTVLTFNTNKSLQQADFYSQFEKIAGGELKPAINTQKTGRLDFTYGKLSKVASYKKDSSVIYKTNVFQFDVRNYLISTYTEKNGIIDGVRTYDYESNLCRYNVTEKKGGKTFANLGATGGILSTSQLQAVFDSSATDFVVTASAQSAGMVYDLTRRKTPFCKDHNHAQDDNANKSSDGVRFEISAKLHYSSGASYDEFVAPFYSSTDKQFIALPIAFRENSDGSYTKPYKIEVNPIFLGIAPIATFSDIKIKECDWNYTDLDKFDNSTFTEQNAVKVSDGTFLKTRTSYTYDKNNKMTECHTDSLYLNKAGSIVKKISEITKNSFNAAGDLVKTESSGDSIRGVNITENFFDTEGRQIKSFSYNTLDAGAKFYSEKEYAENGQVKADKDETGENRTEYEYIEGTNLIRAVKNADGSVTGYGTDPVTDEVISVSSDADGEGSANNSVYKEGFLTLLSAGNNEVGYDYDHLGRKTKVTLNGHDYVKFSYSEEDGNETEAVTLYNNAPDNGDTVYSKTTNSDGKEIESAGAGITIKTSYLEDDKVDFFEAFSGQTSLHKTQYKYYAEGQVREINDGKVTEGYDYDEYGRLKIKTVNAEDDSYNSATTYSYNARNEVCGIKITDAVSKTFATDVNGRETENVIYSGNNKISGEYLYYCKSGDHGTNRISSVRYGSSVNGRYSILEGIKYRYDKTGNISEILENGELSVRYAYDKLGRLIREDNKPFNKTSLFVYDNNGNITSRKECGYTLKATEYIDSTTNVSYAYCDKDKDRLLYFGKEKMQYDSLGNPVVYRNKNVEWEYGRRLKRFGILRFYYDEYGRRKKKGNVSYTHDHSGNILTEKHTSARFNYVYDDSGAAGIKYTVYRTEDILGESYTGEAVCTEPRPETETEYVFRRNVQGDITHIYGVDGEVKACYTYDAWGNHRVFAVDADGTKTDITDSRPSHIGNVNPYRYRGYYWDNETKLYFLQSRYYDPEVGRFLNSDDVSYLDPESIGGLNLYAYCVNNPIMSVDPGGTKWNWLKFIGGLVVAAIVVVGVAALTAATMGAGLAIIGAVTATATTGMSATLISSIVAGAFIGGIIAGTTSYVMIGLEKGFDNISAENIKDIAFSTFTGSIVGGISAGVGEAIKVGSAFAKFATKVLGNLAGWSVGTSIREAFGERTHYSPAEIGLSFLDIIIGSLLPGNIGAGVISFGFEIIKRIFKK